MLDQRQFGLHILAVAVPLQGLCIGIASHACVEVAQIFIGGGIAGVDAGGLLERLRGFLHLALCGVEHGQIVVRLWQVGDVTCQRAKDVYGQIVLLLFCGDHTLQKAHMYVVAVAAQVCLRKRCRFGQLALGHELIDFGDGRGGKACAGKSQGRQCQTGSAPVRPALHPGT